jgi:hypothetical protein
MEVPVKETINNTMSSQVFDGKVFTPVDPAAVVGTPVPPSPAGNGQIFVSVVSYRGTLRLGRFNN